MFRLTVQNKQGTHEQPSQNKKTWIIQVTTHGIKNRKLSQTFEWGYFNNFSHFFLSCGLNMNKFYGQYLTRDSTKKKTCSFCKGFPNFRMPLYIHIHIPFKSLLATSLHLNFQNVSFYICFKLSGFLYFQTSKQLCHLIFLCKP